MVNLEIGKEYWLNGNHTAYGTYLGQEEEVTDVWCFTPTCLGSKFVTSDRRVGGLVQEVVAFGVRKECWELKDSKNSTIFFKVTRANMEKIYNVACSDWQRRITEMIKNFQESPFSNNITLPEEKVEAMFKAADTEKQLPILRKVFPSYGLKESKNAIKGNINRAAVGDINRTLFGRSDVLEVATIACEGIGRLDLKNKSLYLTNEYEIKLHSTPQGGTVLEFNRK